MLYGIKNNSVQIKKFLKSSQNKYIIISGLGMVLSALLGMILLKMIAVYEGPKGVGEFGLYKQFFQFLSVIITFGSGLSLIDIVAKLKNNSKAYAITFPYHLVITLVLASICFLFSNQLSHIIFNDTNHTLLMMITVPILMMTCFLYYFRLFFSGLKMIGLVSLFQVLPVIGMLATLIICYQMEIQHKLFGLYIVSYFITSIVVVYFVNKRLKINYLNLSWKRNHLFEKTSVATLISEFSSFGTILAVKSLVTHQLGISSTGYLESVWLLCWYVPLVFSSALSAYYVPRISVEKDINSVAQKLFGTLITLVLMAFIVLIFLQEFVIKLLYGQQFLEALSILPIMILAEYLRMANIFFQYTLVVISHKKFFILIEVISNLLFLILAYTLIFNLKNLMAVAMSYLIYQVFISACYLTYIRSKKIIKTKNIFLFLVIGFVILVLVEYFR